jgi:thymidine phosphorylase
MAEQQAGAQPQAEFDNLFRDTADLSKAIRYVRDNNAAALLEQIILALGGSVAVAPTIYNVVCPIADTEYSQALPANTKGFLIRARKHSVITFAYTTGASEWLTIGAGVSYEDKNFYSSQTIYFRNSKADEVIEIVTYN